MSIITVLLTIAVVGFLVWLIFQIPMPELFRKIATGLVCLLLIVWVLQMMGVHTGMPLLRWK